MAFLNKCDEFGIVVLILPPHSTHRLQPLDLGCFGPLTQKYSEKLQIIMFEGIGYVGMTKRMFWSVFKPAWEESFSEENITSAFAKAGIWPFNPQYVLTQINRPALEERNPVVIATPYTCKLMRKV
jgi:hypothetical protein